MDQNKQKIFGSFIVCFLVVVAQSHNMLKMTIFFLTFPLFVTSIDMKTTIGSNIEQDFNFLFGSQSLLQAAATTTSNHHHDIINLSSKSSQLRSTGSVTGFLQAVYFKQDVLCSNSAGGAYALDFALGSCIPVKNLLNTVANSYLILSDGSGGINTYLFSDTNCRIAAGAPISVPASTFNVCNNGVKYTLVSGTTSPPLPPFASQTYGSIT